MSDQGKSSIASSIIAAICILIYIAALAFGAVQVIFHMEERRNLGEKEFNDIAALAVRMAERDEFMNAAYSENIRLFLQNSSTPLLGVIITSPAGSEAFEREPGSGIDRSGISPRLRSGEWYLRETIPRSLEIEGRRNVNIYAVYSIIEYNFFISVLWNTLLAIIAALIVALVTFIVELVFRKKAASFQNLNMPKSIHTVLDSNNESAWYDEAMPDFAELEKSAENDIEWKTFIIDRLNMEIDKCVSSGEDLSLVAMQITDDIGVAEYRKIIDDVVSFISMRDLVYEKKDNNIFLILCGSALETSISKLENFRNMAAAGIHAGISSRSGRLVKGERLMLEAETALEKALEDPLSPVIAFRIDPDKYREFMKKNL